MQEFKAVWAFWQDGKGGYFYNPDCPIGNVTGECASYCLCDCSKEKRTQPHPAGVGWQCEHLEGKGEKFFCGAYDKQGE